MRCHPDILLLPLYMAPEQADGESPAPSFDMYALAVTLYESLLGHAPGSDLPLRLMMTLKRLPLYDELSIEGRMMGLRKRLVALVDQGLRRRAEERVQSAAEFRDRLDAVLAELGDEDLPAGIPERPVAAVGVLEEVDVVPTMPSLRVLERVDEDGEQAAQGAVADPLEREIVATVPEASSGHAWRGWAVAAALMVLVLGGGAWWRLAGEPTAVGVSQAATDEREEPSAVAAPAPEPTQERRPEPDQPAPEAMPEPEHVPEIVDAVVEQEHAPEHVPEKPSRKVKVPRQPEAAPEPCTDVAAEAKAASRDKQWSHVLKLTKSPRCWDDEAVRNRLRVKAFLESGQLAECIKLGSTGTQPEVQRIAKRCAKQLEEEGKP